MNPTPNQFRKFLKYTAASDPQDDPATPPVFSEALPLVSDDDHAGRSTTLGDCVDSGKSKMSYAHMQRSYLSIDSEMSDCPNLNPSAQAGPSGWATSGTPAMADSREAFPTPLSSPRAGGGVLDHNPFSSSFTTHSIPSPPPPITCLTPDAESDDDDSYELSSSASDLSTKSTLTVSDIGPGARFLAMKPFLNLKCTQLIERLGSNLPRIPTMDEMDEMDQYYRSNGGGEYPWGDPVNWLWLGSLHREFEEGCDVLSFLGIPSELAERLKEELLAADPRVGCILHVPRARKACPYPKCQAFMPSSNSHKMRHILSHLKVHGVRVKGSCPCCGWLKARSDAQFKKDHWDDSKGLRSKPRCIGAFLKPTGWNSHDVQNVISNINRYLQ